ncbi:MAG: hypothetical protein FWD34_05650 [Oscillospiraceae bacterium]|nr:hypothetical protein [Oscillospiraceae bacterium]
MKINPYFNNEPIKKSPANQSTDDFGFASTLEKVIGENEQDSFVREINSPEHLNERIAHYRSVAVNEEHEDYIRMLEYFKENNKS